MKNWEWNICPFKPASFYHHSKWTKHHKVQLPKNLTQDIACTGTVESVDEGFAEYEIDMGCDQTIPKHFIAEAVPPMRAISSLPVRI